MGVHIMALRPVNLAERFRPADRNGVLESGGDVFAPLPNRRRPNPVPVLIEHDSVLGETRDDCVDVVAVGRGQIIRHDRRQRS